MKLLDEMGKLWRSIILVGLSEIVIRVLKNEMTSTYTENSYDFIRISSFSRFAVLLYAWNCVNFIASRQLSDEGLIGTGIILLT